MLKEDWDLYVMTVAHVRRGWDPTRSVEGASLLRHGVDREFHTREVEAAPSFDARNLLADVLAPSLVILRRQAGDYELDLGRKIAATLPNAVLELVDGETKGIWDENQSVLRVVDRFLTPEEVPGPTVLPMYLQNRSHSLSQREEEVLRLMAEGRQNKEIALTLGLSTNTVSRHLSTIYAKIGGHGRAVATRYAIEKGIVS
jgi:DNA-binding CsgD family transcriptional regulator